MVYTKNHICNVMFAMNLLPLQWNFKITNVSFQCNLFIYSKVEGILWISLLFCMVFIYLWNTTNKYISLYFDSYLIHVDHHQSNGCLSWLPSATCEVTSGTTEPERDLNVSSGESVRQFDGDLHCGWAFSLLQKLKMIKHNMNQMCS